MSVNFTTPRRLHAALRRRLPHRSVRPGAMVIHTGWGSQVAAYASCRRLALVVSKILKHQDATAQLGDHCMLPRADQGTPRAEMTAHDFQGWKEICETVLGKGRLGSCDGQVADNRMTGLFRNDRCLVYFGNTAPVQCSRSMRKGYIETWT
jgi:hypothetical protein